MEGIDYLIGNSSINSFCNIFLIFCAILGFLKITYCPQRGSSNYAVLIILMFVFSLFYSPDAGDSYATLESFTDFKSGVDPEKLHFEIVYFALMKLFSGSYILWRFSVWGLAILIFIILMKKFRCNANVALFVWSILGLQAFYYQRISLAIGLLFISIVELLEFGENKKEYRRLLLFLILFCLSYFFHRSMPIYMLVSIFVLLIGNNRWTMFLGLLLIPIFLPLILDLLSLYLASSSDDIQQWGQLYLDASKQGIQSNFNGRLFEFVRWLPFALMMLCCVVKLLLHPNSMSSYERFFLLFAVVLYLLYFCLQGKVAFAFAGKMKMQSILSMTMFLILYMRKRLNNTDCKIYVLGAFLIFMIVTVKGMI